MNKKKFVSILFCSVFLLFSSAISRAGILQPSPTADTVFVDDFERADGPLGADWLEDSTLVITSGEVDDTDTSSTVDDIAVYLPHTDPVALSLVWGDSAVAEGIDKGGIAVMLSGADTLANGYVIFKNLGTNRYALRLVENGVMTTRIGTGISDRLYPATGDTFQIRLRSDVDGHHFDIFYNHELDATITDPAKTYGNGDTLYCGMLLGGGAHNNVDEFKFISFFDDSLPPSDVTNLTASVRSDSSIVLRWTATGDDSTAGTAKSYEIRHHSELITEDNWIDAVRITGEPVPSAPGSIDSLVVMGLDPDTQYFFAMKVSDGFPSANFSGLSNVATAKTEDFIPPSTISDLEVVGVDRTHVILGWHAPGDTDTLGVADVYDVRYSLNPINQNNFLQATEAVGEPAPLPYGTYQEFTVPGLAPDVMYYFAMKTGDENENWSEISNVVDTTTVSSQTTLAVDDFERAILGPWWTADPELGLAGGELLNLSSEDRWDFVAIFNASPNLEEASYIWSESVDPEGTRNAGLVLMMDAPDPDANGYLIFRHDVLDKISLWNVIGGVPTNQISSVPANLPDPIGGDEIRIVITQDASGNNFDYFVNGVFDNRLSDPDTTYGTSGDWYCGLMLHGGRNNNIEEFAAGGPTAQIPPGPFFLLEPFDGDTLETASPHMDWMDALELNPSDTVYYTLLFGLSPVFDPDSTMTVDSLTVSEYQIPPAQLMDMYTKSSRTSLFSRPTPAGGPSPAKAKSKRIMAGRQMGDAIPNPNNSLPDDAEVFWKVYAFDNTGQDTTESVNTDWSFFVSIPDAPNPFDLIAPVDGDTIKTPPLAVLLTWHTATDPDPDDTTFIYSVTYRRAGDTPVTVGGLTDTTFTTPELEDNSTYTWFVTAEDQDTLTRDSEMWTFYTRLPSGIDGPDGNSGSLPRIYALSQNYPNPFNPETTISFDVPESAVDGVRVTLEIFSLRGMKVRTLLQNRNMKPGTHDVTWNGRNEHGDHVGSGIYIYRIKAGEFTGYRKMVLLK